MISGSPPASSYYVSLGLFVITIPGLWSLIKRAPRATVKRKVFQVDGPAVEGSMAPGARARQILEYFMRYNYEVKDMGEVITFEGNYRASAGEGVWVSLLGQVLSQACAGASMSPASLHSGCAR